MLDFFAGIWSDIVAIINAVDFRDILDIAIVSFLLYKAFKLIKETRAIQLLKGILIITIAFVLASRIGLRTMTVLLSNILQIGAFALVVVFQPELRRALEKMGRTSFGNVFRDDAKEGATRIQSAIQSVVSAVGPLSLTCTGALIVIERKTKLGDQIKSGTIINSDPSPELIQNIFFKNSPLHDGAMIMRDGKIHAAGCYLPLSENYDISKQLGTRHRAALGMSEQSDAVIVVVSEETGTISVAINGTIYRNFDARSLKSKLEAELLPEKHLDDSARKPGFWRVKL